MNIHIGNVDIVPYIVIVIGYIIIISTSGLIVRHFIGTQNEGSNKKVAKPRYDVGTIIGKCENFIILSLILANAYTGLALIFAAKAIVRSENIRKDPKYYLGGTLVNFSYSLLIGLIMRIILGAMGNPLKILFSGI